ncbi:MAG TPA: ABC transporter permease subunit [Candidatus Nanoarchaeia archaeon]|nr:ABC transporter permease subunit [Candidatus Nanoarchaeia archaeon]
MTEKLAKTLDKLSSRNAIKYAVYASAIIIFFTLILIPPLAGIFIKWGSVQYILNQPSLVNRALSAIQNSFIIALTVAALDLLVGVPMAWLIARGKSRWLSAIDTLADIPFIIPTTALGYSLLLFWSGSGGVSALFGASIVSPGWLLVMLLHFTFSFPVVVRVMVGALLDYKMEYERASRTLGAAPFTAMRTVTIPVLKPAMISAYILAFARSVSETGATIIVAGVFENGSVFIQNIKNQYSTSDPMLYNGAVVFGSFLLIIISIAIFVAIHFLGPKLRLPLKRVRPETERKLSYKKAEKSRNTVILVIFFALILLPSLFVALSAFQAVPTLTFANALTGRGIWSGYWQSLLISYTLGAVVTVINIIIGLPTAIIIARKKAGKFMSSIFDLLINIPLVVPSIALGVSLGIFWKANFASLPDFALLVLAHLAITYPYFVRSMSAALERISPDMEEAARTLGAKPLGVFRTIVFPLTKYSMLSGAIMVFTRSVSETGATLAVTSKLQTAPVLLVNWIKHTVPNVTSLDIALASGFLVLFSFIILLVLRLVVGREEKILVPS